VFIRELTAEECDQELSRASLGRLGCALDHQPYVVPIYFVVEDHHVYSFSMPGKKIDWMRINPRVCLQMDRVTSPSDWASIIAVGRFDELRDIPERREERAHAYRLLQTRPTWWEPGSVPVTRPSGGVGATPIFYRIDLGHITGQRASQTSNVA
jgi:nitroimidazol reductase NimA-like FMN-containing flavoprotein (pyridoxamine 5'-phosphate oxidase superfamily)